MEEIERRTDPDVQKCYDDLDNPESFDFIEEIANNIPFIPITHMVGIPEKYWDDIKPCIMKFTEAWNPTLPPNRIQAAVDARNIAIDIIREVIVERRQLPFQDNDFLSILLKAEQSRAEQSRAGS